MRKRFEAQLTLGSTPIEQIQFPLKSRDELPPFLRAMQYIYTDKELSEQVYKLLEAAICTKKPTGRLGMDLWTIFVLAGVRLCRNTDYDHLHHVANYDTLVRQMLGVHDGITRGRDFHRQTIIDNVQLLDDNTLREINAIIVQSGHQLLKKKETEALHIKIDSFVTEANVHFPTDYNLLWDSGRKCLDVLKKLINTNRSYLSGWKDLEIIRRKLKNKMLTLSRSLVDRSKKRAVRVYNAALQYLDIAWELSDRLSKVKPLNWGPKEMMLFVDLKYFQQMLDKHIGLVDRRLLQDEQIPHDEKIFSIFEPWVEWISKGKAYKPVEIGTLTCVASDQWHFIVDWWAADHQTDSQMIIPAIDRIRDTYEKVAACSSDKGFFSKINVETINNLGIKPIIPKKGKRSLSDIQRESDPEFIKARHAHSAIESNINELEHRGLNRCPDKGKKGMHRYIGLAVIAYNLRRFGKILLDIDREKEKRKTYKFRRAA